MVFLQVVLLQVAFLWVVLLSLVGEFGRTLLLLFVALGPGLVVSVSVVVVASWSLMCLLSCTGRGVERSPPGTFLACACGGGAGPSVMVVVAQTVAKP